MLPLPCCPCCHCRHHLTSSTPPCSCCSCCHCCVAAALLLPLSTPLCRCCCSSRCCCCHLVACCHRRRHLLLLPPPSCIFSSSHCRVHIRLFLIVVVVLAVFIVQPTCRLPLHACSSSSRSPSENVDERCRLIPRGRSCGSLLSSPDNLLSGPAMLSTTSSLHDSMERAVSSGQSGSGSGGSTG